MQWAPFVQPATRAAKCKLELCLRRRLVAFLTTR